MRARGVTLVELLVVLAVLGVLTALGLGSFREGSIRARLREGAQVVARGIDRAREDARTENRVVAVRIPGGADAIEVDGRSAPLPAGVVVARAQERPWLVFVPPYGAAFASADAEHDPADARFALQRLELAWAADPERRQALHIVGTLGKPVLR